MNQKRQRYRTCILLLAAALTVSSAVPAFGADSGGTPAPGSSAVFSTGNAPAIGLIQISDTNNFELKNLTMLTEQGNRTVTFTVTVNNGSSSDLLFIDYWVRLRTKSGNEISVRVLPQDKDKNRITPKSSQDITFYATVNDTTELNDLIFEFIKWDFSQPNFERKIGEVTVPEDYGIVTAAGGAQTIQMAGNPVKTSVKKVLLSKNEKNYTPTVVITLENIGNRSAAVPGYQYLLRTSEGYMYPLDAKSVKDLTINPQMNKDVELSGSVPVSVSTEGWQLVIVQNAADLKLNLPIAFFALPQVTDPDSVDTGIAYNFSNKSGTYTAQLNSVQRLPWEDQDILSARLTLSNKGPESLPMPDLTGYFMLDDAVKVEAKLVRTDKVIGLTPNASAEFQLIGKIPYTYEFSNVKLVLQEKTASGDTGAAGGSSQTSDLLEFVHRSELMKVPFSNVGETYKVANIGRSASYRVRRVMTYTGETADTFAVQLEAVNQEKRFTDVTKLVAHFKTVDGTVYPAVVSEIKNKVSPGGAALLYLTSNVPKGFDTSGMSLMIGEGVTEDKLTEKDKKPDAYVNAAAFWLPKELTEVKDELQNIDLAPYKLSISKIYTQLDPQGVHLTFNYELSKNLLLEMNTEGRKLIVAVEDEGDKVDITKEFDFKDFEVGAAGSSGGAAAGAQTGNNDGKIKLGSYVDFKIDVNDKDLIFYVETLKNYRLSIYDSFQGQKKLLASKKIQWFERMD